MKIRDLVRLTNTYLTGEQLVYHKLIPFFDAVIDDINDRLNSTYPSFTSLNVQRIDSDEAEYNYFPERYLRSVVAIGAAHKFYVMDEEGVAHDQTYAEEYEKGLFYMTRDFIEHVPERYSADGTGSVRLDESMFVNNGLPFHFDIWR